MYLSASSSVLETYSEIMSTTKDGEKKTRTTSSHRDHMTERRIISRVPARTYLDADFFMFHGTKIKQTRMPLALWCNLHVETGLD